ncbi:MAG: sialate O-acetylesterase [Bacteroidetes bacterium]|nr:sialate O-acetylesterase [Bacteroidota bacterium]
MKHLAVLLLLLVMTLQADVRLPAVFGSGMLLQRNQPVPVWGFAAPAESVVVTFQKQLLRTVAGPDGRWRVTLQPLTEGGPYELTVNGRNSIRLTNILVGEVWLASGQSNMSFELEKDADGKNAVAASSLPNIRLFNVKRVLSDTLMDDVQGKWQECSPSVAGDFSAVAFYFGRMLQDSLKVPVGLIHSSWGGTAAEGWMPRNVLEEAEDLRPILRRWMEDSSAYPERIASFNAELPALTVQWRKDSAEAVSLGRALPRKPTAPRGPGHRDTPSGQFNGMLHPIIPFAIRGVIWYQGEGNASRAHQYRRLFPALITTWRSLWGQGDFPFYYVQLPNLDRQPEPSRSGWAELREAQLMTLALPNTGMAVTIDVGDPKDLHPTNKRPVGERLARIALARTYGKNIAYAAPRMQKANVAGKSIIVDFEKNGEMLTVLNGTTLKGFTIAGKDKKFVPATAVLQGNTVTVSSPLVKEPVAVRYAWADNPTCNLYTVTGLPVGPFRSDVWPEVTAGKK